MTMKDLDHTLAAYLDSARTWLRGLSGAVTESRSGLFAVRSGIPNPQFNTAWWVQPASAKQAADALDHMSDTPHSLNIGGPQPDEVFELLGRRGMRHAVTMAGMSADDPDMLRGPEVDLTVTDARDVGSLADFRRVLAPTFGMSDPVLAAAMPDSQLLAEQAVFLVGYIHERPVASSLSITVDRTTSVFCVATIPEYQRNGFGAAMTKAAVRAGLQLGADHAYLEATPQGDALYRRMGFVETNTWQSWQQVPEQPEPEATPR
jgi:ribosomal protein S18 acetylase RimI-like enzyme